MTLFEITAVDIDETVRACCPGAVRSAGLGRARGFVDAAEIRADARRGTGQYYAMVGGMYRDVIAVDCLECGEPYLTTTARFVRGNELLALPPLTVAAAA